jgi:cytochrome P450
VEVAAELPVQTIGEIMGVPVEDRHRLFASTTTILDYADRELDEVSPVLFEAEAGLRV